MKVITSASEMHEVSSRIRSEAKTIGFVPTMGALHQGHGSLIRSAREKNETTIVSVFVNPTQFNDAKDLSKYPRTFDADKELLERLGVDVMFFPSEKEIYPNPNPIEYQMDGLDSLMEGPNRPGHFNGVVQVVTRLFDIVLPDRAYFGEKDFQQLTILRYMSKKLGYEIEVIGCPTIREKSGLAMSSRNTRLSENNKRDALLINQVLTTLKKDLVRAKLEEAIQYAYQEIEASQEIELEYLELVNPETLQQASDSSESIQACIAAWVGEVRLIDNMRVK